MNTLCLTERIGWDYSRSRGLLTESCVGVDSPSKLKMRYSLCFLPQIWFPDQNDDPLIMALNCYLYFQKTMSHEDFYNNEYINAALELMTTKGIIADNVLILTRENLQRLLDYLASGRAIGLYSGVRFRQNLGKGSNRIRTKNEVLYEFFCAMIIANLILSQRPYQQWTTNCSPV